MNGRFLLATALATVFAAGCIPTLQSVYTDDDLVSDPLLIGSWKADGDNTKWQFARGEGKTYRLTLTDGDGKAGEFKSHLTRFDGLTYLDLQPTDKGITGNDVYKAYLLPLHTFFRVDQLGDDKLCLSSMDGEWLKQQLQKDPKILKHEQVNGGYLITAASKDLQQFLKQHQDTPGAFASASVLQRQAE